jgi:hypothetical protein
MSTVDSSTVAAVSALRTLSEQTDFRAVMFTYSCGLTFQFPDDFKANKFPGLVFCGVIRNSESSQVQSCWKNRSCCDTYEPLFRAELSLSEPNWAGAVAQFETPQRPWWRRHSISLGKFLLGLAALFGALSAVRDHFADLLAPPDVALYIAESAPVEYAAGSRLALPVKILNLERFGRATVNLNGALLRLKANPSVTVPLQFDTPGVPQLAPGQAVEAHLLGEAPTVQPGVDPQDYELELTVRATGGLFLGSRLVPFKKRTFKVWSSLAWKVTLQVPTQNQQVAYVDVAIYPGRPFSGARGYVLLHLPEAPERVELVCCAISSRNINNSVKGHYASKLEFNTSALQPLQPTTEHVVVAFKRNLTKAEWAEVLNSIKVRVEGSPI